MSCYHIKKKFGSILLTCLVIIFVYISYLYLCRINTLSLSPDRSFFKSMEHIGILTWLSFFPVITLLYWIYSQKIRVTYISLILMIISLYLYQYFRYVSCINNYLTILFLSFIYGLICSCSCLTGLKIKKSIFLDERMRILTNALVLVSVGVVFFLFLLERIHSDKNFIFDRFMIAFVVLILAISFLYVAFGYLSRISYYRPDLLTFFIFACISFAVGFTLSIFVIELAKKTGLLPSHWVFICIWSAFIGDVCIIISNISSNSYFVRILRFFSS